MIPHHSAPHIAFAPVYFVWLCVVLRVLLLLLVSLRCLCFVFENTNQAFLGDLFSGNEGIQQIDVRHPSNTCTHSKNEKRKWQQHTIVRSFCRALKTKRMKTTINNTNTTSKQEKHKKSGFCTRTNCLYFGPKLQWQTDTARARHDFVCAINNYALVSENFANETYLSLKSSFPPL